MNWRVWIITARAAGATARTRSAPTRITSARITDRRRAATFARGAPYLDNNSRLFFIIDGHDSAVFGQFEFYRHRRSPYLVNAGALISNEAKPFDNSGDRAYACQMSNKRLLHVAVELPNQGIVFRYGFSFRRHVALVQVEYLANDRFSGGQSRRATNWTTPTSRKSALARSCDLSSDQNCARRPALALRM